MLLAERKNIIYSYISRVGRVTAREVAAKVIMPVGLRGDMESATKMAFKLLSMLVKDDRVVMEDEDYYVSD